MEPIAQAATSRLAEDLSHERKVLIVDDREDVRWVLSNLMRNAGFAPLVAADGKQALAIIESEAPDLVLLDVCLPDMDGFDVLTWATRESR